MARRGNVRHMEQPTTSGKDLRLLRIAADVRAIDLAAVMGIQPSGVSRIEGLRRVTDKARTRYVTALATFATSDAHSDGTAA